MKERPILFSGAMVRAILCGSKTQTRRLVKARPDWAMGKRCILQPHELAGEVNQGEYSNCPYGKPGDRLWVRETFRVCPGGDIAYKANCVYKDRAWKPSIHMPRTASRITLEIAGVRVERLQDMHEDDAVKEGTTGGYGLIPNYPYHATSWEHYRYVLESISGPGSWDANPWVYVIEFKRVMS